MEKVDVYNKRHEKLNYIKEKKRIRGRRVSFILFCMDYQ